MPNNFIFNVMLIVVLITRNLRDSKGLQLCEKLGALEQYGPDKLCCNKEVVAIVDADKRKRQCCSNILYYIDDHVCIDGKLHSVSPPDPLPPDPPKRTRTKEPNVKLSEMKFGLRLCGTLWALEAYGPDKICCDKKVHDRVDVDKRRRDCCLNLLYYTDVYECVDGELQGLNPPDPSPFAPTRPRKKVPGLRICEKHFVYRIRKIHMKKNSDQHVRATIAGLNLKRLNMTKHAKWWKEKQININMKQSLYKKYVGKSFFVYSDKNLFWENSLNLSSGDIIIRNKFRIRYIKKCSEGRIISGANVVN